VGAVLVRPGDEIMLITEGGTLIRTSVDQIPVVGRSAQGVKLISLGQGERLRYLERIVALEGDDAADTAPDPDSEPDPDDRDSDAGRDVPRGDDSEPTD